ncbi:MAG: beta-lactamase family protein [Candidatus Obscuribacterales bacterium]|nr:beta-lactamase family protein [Steroidobacteraceae bacterium]
MTPLNYRSAIFLALMSSAAIPADYKPVLCSEPRPYNGKPLFQGAALLPAEDFTLGIAFDTATNERLNQAVTEAMKHTKARAMTAAVASIDGMWKADQSADGTTPPVRFYWASVGKSLTATVILQLVEENKVSLDDSIARWLPAFPNSSAIRIDDLLQHTAGVFSANEDLVVRRERRYRSSDEGIAIAKKHGPMFCAGEHWRYSNTGYEMLGKIIEAIEARPYHEVIKRRISDPLKLTTLRALAPAEEPTDVAKLLPTQTNEPAVIPSWANAAGNVVGSAEDMLKFWHALLTSKLLSQESTQRRFERLYPMFDAGTFYGRGVMLYSFVDGAAEKTWLGHSGGAPGVKAVVAFSPDTQTFVAVALTGDGSAEASANLLLKRLRNL